MKQGEFTSPERKGKKMKPDKKFWDKVKKARQSVLALDYDGAIAPFRAERLLAAPLPGIPELLDSMLKLSDTHLALVTGRTLRELDEVSAGLSRRVAVVGSHGWELRFPGEPAVKPSPGRDLSERLDHACALALASGYEELWSREQAELRVECKPAGVAVHARGLRKSEAETWLCRVRNDWAPLVGGDFDLLEFNGGVELRLAGRNKGAGILALLQKFPAADLLAYVGDDLTDEDAFRALPQHGIGIKVGNVPARTGAAYRLADVEAVRDFLAQWERTARPGKGGRRG